MFQPTTQGLEINTSITIPIEPINKIPRTLSPFELDYLANGDCVCWELIGSLASLGEYDAIVERICGYHKQYLSNRAASSNIPCACLKKSERAALHGLQEVPQVPQGPVHHIHGYFSPLRLPAPVSPGLTPRRHRCCCLLGVSPDHLDQTRRRRQ